MSPQGNESPRDHVVPFLSTELILTTFTCGCGSPTQEKRSWAKRREREGVLSLGSSVCEAEKANTFAGTNSAPLPHG